RAVRSTSVRYRLSKPTKHDASLVALPDNTSRSPVAKGSSVPACPVRAPVRRRISATIANEDGPAGLSTSTRPFGLSARGGTLELAVDELGDLLDRGVAREARSLAMAAARGFARDRGDVQLVGAGAEADAARGPLPPGRLPDERRHVGSLDRAEVVDDSLRVRLGDVELGEVAPEQVGDDEPAALVHLGA